MCSYPLTYKCLRVIDENTIISIQYILCMSYIYLYICLYNYTDFKKIWNHEFFQAVENKMEHLTDPDDKHRCNVISTHANVSDAHLLLLPYVCYLIWYLKISITFFSSLIVNEFENSKLVIELVLSDCRICWSKWNIR